MDTYFYHKWKQQFESDIADILSHRRKCNELLQSRGKEPKFSEARHFVVFVSESGYFVMHRDDWEKQSKRDQKKITSIYKEVYEIWN